MASVERTPNGRWRARWREYANAPPRSRTFDRKVDATRWLVEVEHQLQHGSYVSPEAAQVPLGEYVAAHLARQPWRASTARVATNALGHAVRVFGADRPVNSIRKADVQAFVAGLDLAPSTVGTVHQHLTGLLAAAVDDGLLIVNPAKGVRLPRSEAGEVVPPTAEDVDALLAAAPAWFRVGVVLGAGLGLRQGEASGLTSDRVDWLAGRTVRVDRQWLGRGEGGRFGPPKSPSSVRSIPAAGWVLEELGRTAAPGGFVLHEGDPAVAVHHNRFAYVWRQTVRRAGLDPALRFHALRHRFASMLISGGCSIVAVQRAMGHANAATTLGLYGHLMPSDTDRIRQAVEASRAALA